MTWYQCLVVCSCGLDLGRGRGESEAMAAYHAGRLSDFAFNHVSVGHSIRLKIRKEGS